MTANQLKWLELEESKRAARAKEEETKRSNLANEVIKGREADIKAKEAEISRGDLLRKISSNLSDIGLGLLKVIGGR